MNKIISLLLTACIIFSYSVQSTAAAEEDPDMLEYATLIEPTSQELLENEIYYQLNETLNGDYLIDVQAFYESKEAIEEGIYNSNESEYFGYLLSEVDAYFEDTPYVFSVDQNGETIVSEFVPYDDLWDKTLLNVALGSGVILICVTVSALTTTVAPAVHLVFAYAANHALKYGGRGAALAAIKSALSRYAQTGDIEEALRYAALGASEGYKWGALGGTITGAAAESINLAGLKRATKMSMNDIADIQTKSNFTDTTIKNIKSMDEFKVYQNANLVEYNYNGRTFLIPKDMNWDFVDPATGLTNRQLIEAGYNPVDKFGIKYQLHHVGQKTNSPLALLTQEQHQGNSSILHTITTSEVRPQGDNSLWIQDKKNALQTLAALLSSIL